MNKFSNSLLKVSLAIFVVALLSVSAVGYGYLFAGAVTPDPDSPDAAVSETFTIIDDVTNSYSFEQTITDPGSYSNTIMCTDPIIEAAELADGGVCAINPTPLEATAFLEETELEDGTFTFNLFEGNGTTPIQMGATEIDPAGRAEQSGIVVEVVYTPADPAVICPATVRFPVTFDNSFCGCDLSITEVTPVCTYIPNEMRSSYTISVSATADPVLSGENVSFEFDGVVRANTTVQPNGNITFANVSIPNGPALDYTTRLFLIDNPGCDSERSIDLVACSGRCEDAVPGAGQNLVGGQVFIDDNLNGTLDGGETGPGLVRVRVYDCNDNLVAQDLTDETGNWFVRPLEAGQQYRVEFDTPRNPELESSLSGPDNGSNVQFITVQPGRNCNNNYGLTDPTLYCQENPLVLMPCYYVGPQNNGRPALVATYYNDPESRDAPVEMLLDDTDIGTTWGLAYQTDEQRLYMATVVRNFMGYGPGGFDAIYVADLTDEDGPTGNDPELSGLNVLNLRSLPRLPGVAAVNLGVDPRAGVGESTADGQPIAIPGTNIKYRDDAWRGVGKSGIGDIDISPDGDTLFVVNLNEAAPSLLSIDVSDPGSPVVIGNVPIADPGCTNGNFAPWALKYFQGSVYVGVTCTAENGGTAADLSVTVFRYDGGTTFTSVASADLDYARSAGTYRSNGTFNSAEWRPWTDQFPTASNLRLPLGSRPLITYAMPMASDIEFGDDGSLYLAIGDRFTFMTAFKQQAWGTTSNGQAFTPVAAGDLLRFCQQGDSDTYAVEGTNGCPQPVTDAASQSLSGVPIITEYFEDDFVRVPDAGHAESTIGSMAKIPGRRELVTTVFDPIVRGGPVNTSGIRYYSEDGSYTKGLVIVNSDAFQNNAKGGSLGDLEIACDPGPIELGNYVWFDLDGDGAQDPCEPPVAGVLMKLFLRNDDGSATQLATTTTSATGNYSFIADGVDANGDDFDDATWSGAGAGARVSSTEQYFIAACGDSFTAEDSTLLVNGTSYSLTVQNTGARNDADLSDSDFFVLDINGTNLPAYRTVGDDVRGSNNSLDLGLRPPPCELDFENLMVSCTNDNEFTVTFELDYDYDDAMAPGEQLFVQVNGENVGDSPYTLTENTGTITGLTFTSNTPQFGVDVRTFFAINRDCEISRVIDLVACTDPCAGPGQVGGNVYLDNNNNGINDDTEFGLGNVSVKVYSCEDGDEPVCETFTNTNGGWSCPNITDGREYRVEYSRPLRPNLEEAFAGPDNLTGVQFITGGTCASSYGLLDPGTYCNQEMLSLAVSCYETGSLEGGTNGGNPAFVSLSADDSGTTPPPSTDLTLAQVGSIWGTAHIPQTSTVYAGAVLKRHTAVVDGLGFLYELDYTNIAAPTLVQGLNLEGVVPQNRPSRPLEFGTVCRGGPCVDGPGNTGFQDDYVLPDNPTDLSRDLDAFTKVGKVGYGDVDYDPASGLLWMVNLNERTLLSMDVSAANPLTTINAYEINDAFGIPACPGGEPRPWGLHFRNGLGYLGLVCDAAGTQSLDDLESFVMQFDPADPDNSFTTLVRIPIQEDSHISSVSNDTYIEEDYLPWFNTYGDLPAQLRDSLAANDNFNGVQTLRVGQPILSDIDFTPAGDLIVSIMDRTAMQFGYLQSTPQSRSEILVNPISYGDLIWLCPRGDGGFRKEASPGSCDPSTTGSPFYPQFGAVPSQAMDDYFDLAAGDGSYDGALGSHTVLNDGQVVYPTYDPFPPGEDVSQFQDEDPDAPNFNPYINTQGLHYNSLTDGSRLDWYRIVGQGFERQEYGKGIGLGDLIALCDEPAIQLGNYVWLDENEDGIQDACEPPIAGMTVKLYAKPTGAAPAAAPVLLATTTTNDDGNYYFAGRDDDMATWEAGVEDSIIAGNQYFIAFCGDGGYDAIADTLSVMGQRLCITANDVVGTAANPDNSDSDITELLIDGVGILPAYCTVAGQTDSTNHTFDAGFKPVAKYDLALRKTLSAGQNVGFRAGDQVSFDIEVLNQSDTTVYAIAVGDSLPAGLAYVANAGITLTSARGTTVTLTDGNAANATGVLSFELDSLLAADSVVFTVQVMLDDPFLGDPTELVNVAEIQAFDDDRDPNNEPPADEDSTPDGNFSNDTGGEVGGPSDNVTDSIPPFDEDDADPARITIYDLALTKVIDPGSLDPTGSYAVGAPIVYNLNVTNQGTDTVGSLELVDFIPCGFTFDPALAANAGWTEETDDVLARFTQTIDIAPGDGLQVQITLNFAGEGNCAMPTDTAFLNRAEISGFTDTDGNAAVDFDSTPDDVNGNDPGGVVNSVSDNQIDGNGSGAAGSDDPDTDEDDSDPANLDVFDLAIFKIVAPENMPEPYNIGDVVKFDIGVISQGNLATTGVTISDLTPPGLRYDQALGMNAAAGNGAGWQGGPDSPTLTITDFTGLVNGAPTQSTLGFQDTATVSIWLEVVPAGGTQANYTNFAQIETGTFEDNQGNRVTVTGDGDSPFALGFGNDPGGGVGTVDDNETTNSRPGEDIDSQDPAFVSVLLGVAVGDTTFIDVNGDGLQDDGDLPLEGVTVTLFDAETGQPVTMNLFGDPVSPLVTDADGSYLFSDLPSGNYFVQFDISTAVNGDLYNFTQANAGNDDALDSDVLPAGPMDSVGNSDPTGLIPAGDTVLTLDAGVVCAIEVEVSEPFTVCSTQPIDLTQGAGISPARLGGFWTTTGTGTFFNAAGAELEADTETGGFPFGTAVRYEPSPADARAGEITFTLTSNDPADLMPASVCAPVAASVTVTVLQVDCGGFFWDGGEE